MTRERIEEGQKLICEIDHINNYLTDSDFESIETLDQIIYEYDEVKTKIFEYVRTILNQKLHEAEHKLNAL